MGMTGGLGVMDILTHFAKCVSISWPPTLSLSLSLSLSLRLQCPRESRKLGAVLPDPTYQRLFKAVARLMKAVALA
jgi:hypothetical protein